MEKAIEVLATANRIYFYGIGGSGGIARIAHHLFLKAGIFSTVYDDGYMQAVSAALLQKGDVVVGISHAGSTKDVVEALAIAKSTGASTIAITGNEDSEIIKVADIKLVTSFKEEPIYGDFMEAKIGQLYIIDLLYIGILLRDVPAANNKTIKHTDTPFGIAAICPSIWGWAPRRRTVNRWCKGLAKGSSPDKRRCKKTFARLSESRFCTKIGQMGGVFCSFAL